MQLHRVLDDKVVVGLLYLLCKRILYLPKRPKFPLFPPTTTLKDGDKVSFNVTTVEQVIIRILLCQVRT